MGRLPIPYYGQIGHQIRSKELIQIGGFMPADAERFTVNFHCDDNIALHFDVRFFEDDIVRNSLIDGCWGEEERGGSFYFQKNHYFDIAILVKGNKFKLSVNGKGSFSYDHRLDMNDINYISISSEGAEVYVNNITFKLPVEDGVQTDVTISGHTKLPKKYSKYLPGYASESSSDDSD